jgi:hypothetical protein
MTKYKFIYQASAIFAIFIFIGALHAGAFGQQPNDNFADAETLVGIQVHITRSNVGATKEAGEPNHANNQGGKSVWFKWTAPMSRVVSVTTNRSPTNIDTLLHVYTGAALNNLSPVTGSNNIWSPTNLRSFARFNAIAGTTYYIAVDGAFANQTTAEGAFQLDLQPSFNFQGADYDSDGKTDFSVYRPAEGIWYIWSSAAQRMLTQRWGTSGDVPLVGSLTGSGVNEYTIYRPSSGTWYHRPVCCSDTYLTFGTSEDIPVPAQYGGGEGTNFAVFRPSNGIWYIYYTNDNISYRHFGLDGDVPVPGHYSPDAFADLAVFRPSNGTWYILKRKSNSPVEDVFAAVRFGQAGDKPVPADYDGDGLLDIAVFRPATGEWFVLRSSDGQYTVAHFGLAGDIPTTGDFNGDGRADYAVFRPSAGMWFVARPNGVPAQDFDVFWFGQNGDIPVTANAGR